MYKQLKKQISDKKIIHDIRAGIEDRIQFKIDKQLGMKGMSFQEVKIELKNSNSDRFVKAFSDIEELDIQRQELLEEERIIDKMLEKVDCNITKLNDIELKVFRAIYLWSKTQQEIADIEGYSLSRIKQISQNINEKLNS